MPSYGKDRACARIFGVISTQKSGGCSKAAEPETP